MSFSFSIEQIEGLTQGSLVRLGGFLSFEELEPLKVEIKKLALEEKKYIIFDLSDLSEIDSAGLGFFIRSVATVNSWGGRMALCNVEANLERIFRFIRLPITETFEEALEKVKK